MHLVTSGASRLYCDFDPDPRRTFHRHLFSDLERLAVEMMFSAWSGPLDGELLDAMGKGFRAVEIVISPDTGSERLRHELLSRGYGRSPYYSNGQLDRFLKDLDLRGFKAMCYFVTGLPWETREDYAETIRMVTHFRKTSMRADFRCAPPECA